MCLKSTAMKLRHQKQSGLPRNMACKSSEYPRNWIEFLFRLLLVCTVHTHPSVAPLSEHTQTYMDGYASLEFVWMLMKLYPKTTVPHTNNFEKKVWTVKTISFSSFYSSIYPLFPSRTPSLITLILCAHNG